MVKFICFLFIFIFAGMMCIDGMMGCLSAAMGFVGWLVVATLAIIGIVKAVCEMDDEERK